jgi:hypothetical protein
MFAQVHLISILDIDIELKSTTNSLILLYPELTTTLMKTISCIKNTHLFLVYRYFIDDVIRVTYGQI